MPATRATTAAGRPRATTSRDRATRSLTPSPATVPPRSRPPSSCAPTPLQPRDLPRSSSASVRSVFAVQPLGAGGKKLLAPLSEQAVGDVVLTAELGDRLRAAQRREHQLGLLLRRELRYLRYSLDAAAARREQRVSAELRTEGRLRRQPLRPTKKTSENCQTPRRGPRHARPT